MINKKLYWLSIPLVCYTIYNKRKIIYYTYKKIQIWTIIKTLSFLKRNGLLWWWKDVPKLTPDEKFINKCKEKFLEITKGSSDNDGEVKKKLNSNISDIYYNKNEMNAVILNNRDNIYELEWKKRILIMNTPYGNIGMYYNLYNRSFSYYSDVKNIPYTILNCVSMNYVIKYFCLDFYIDNTMVDNWVSPFWEIWDKEVKEESVENKPFIPRLNDDNKPKRVVIAKLKNYRLDFGKDEKGEPNIIYNKNRFIYCGKVTDMMVFNIKKPTTILKPKKMSFQEFKKKLLLKSDDGVGGVVVGGVGGVGGGVGVGGGNYDSLFS